MSTLQSDIQTKSAASTDKPKYKGKTGARILHEMLVGPHKVEYMFGYPGGAILPFFDELYKTPAKFILNRHEQGSGHCADGYARVTGKDRSEVFVISEADFGKLVRKLAEFSQTQKPDAAAPNLNLPKQ